MPNELLITVDLIFIYSSVILFYKFLGKTGMYCWTVIATISANIEVLMIVNAFGMEQTLGNILFASTFIVTDILSETEGKKSANKAVIIGIFTSFIFILISQMWLLYTPNSNDWAYSPISKIFSNTPRLMLSSFVVYAIVQAFDVFAYHAIWKKTTEIFKSSRKFLWLRNNAATLLSQLLNSFLYNFAAFYGTYPVKTVLNIVFSSYIIFIVTSLLDTPVVYIARSLKEKGLVKQ